MVYYSLFDKLADSSAFGDGKSASNIYGKQMHYLGSLSEVLGQLEDDLASPLMQPTEIARVALNAPRLVRAAVDHKINHPCEESEALLEKALELALEIYRSSFDVVEKIRAFKASVTTYAPDLLTIALAQPDDKITWEATRPERSRITAARMGDAYQGRDLLMIALAHGGVAAGMDVFLRYCDLVKSEESDLYVVRFSTQKLGDKAPRLTYREIVRLKEGVGTRQPVIFDLTLKN